VRLASPSMFLKTFSIGRDQLLLFMVTMGVTLAYDLLLGVIAGILLKLFIHSMRGLKLNNLIISPLQIQEEALNTCIALQGPAVFSNYFSLQKHIQEALKNPKPVVIDFSAATLVDHTTLNSLYSLVEEVGADKLIIRGLEKLKPLSKHRLSTHRYA
jgi:MFS superfamily sulfate permease-like transporter